jgi:hypothetical protein
VTTTYTLTATNAAGSVTSTQTVESTPISSTANATWYISTTGSDTNDGTSPSTAFATAAHALAAISPCDTLILEDGYYYDYFLIDEPNLNGNANGSGCYTTIKAATPWGVTVDSSQADPEPNGTFLFYSANYVQVIGIKAAGNSNWDTEKQGGGADLPWFVDSSNHIKLQQTAGFNAPCWENTDVYAVGPGSSYVLVEDSHAWGCGRYKFMSYQSDHVIFRRDVARHDMHDPTGWTGPNTISGWGRQCGDFVNYDGQYTIFQNDIAIDSGLVDQETGVVYGGLWSEHNDTAIDNPIEVEGMVVINVQGESAWQDAKQSGVHTFVNDAAVNSEGGLMIGYLTGDGVTPPTTSVTHMTIANLTGTSLGNYDDNENSAIGVGVSGGSAFSTYTSQTVANNIFQNITSGDANSYSAADWVKPNYDYYYENTANFGATSYEGYMPTAGAKDVLNTNPQIKYITREEPGTPVYATASDGGNVGATILYEIGTTGTLYGDTGYDTITNTSLWPFPNEGVIKADMASFSWTNPVTGNLIIGARGFAASGTGLYGGPITLTSYVWEALGNACPSGICP